MGPKTIAAHIKPRLFEAAAKAGRGEPRILATLPICVTDNERMIRTLISKNLAFYATLPSYKAMFVREGISAPGDLALVGSPAKVAPIPVKGIASEGNQSGWGCAHVTLGFADIHRAFHAPSPLYLPDALDDTQC